MLKLQGEYAAAIQSCIDLLSTLDFDLNELIEAKGIDRIALLSDDGPALNAIYTNDESRIRYEVFAQDLIRKHKSLAGSFDLLKPYGSSYNALEMLYKKLLEKQRSDTDLGDIFRSICAEVGDAIEVRATQAPGAASERIYDLSNIDFDRLKAEFAKSPAKQVQVQDVKSAITQRLKKLLQQNPQSPQRRDLYARYQEISSNYNRETDRLTIEQTFEELLRLVEALDDEEKRHVREGLSEPNLALFDILCNYKAGIKPATRERLKQVAQSLLQIIQAQLQQIENWQAKDTTKSQIENLIRDHLYSEETGLPLDDFEEEDVNSSLRRFFCTFISAPLSI